MNPLYIEYYSHDGCDCYKIDLPWTKYKKETIVLCTAADGLENARELAREAINAHLENVLQEELSSSDTWL